MLLVKKYPLLASGIFFLKLRIALSALEVLPAEGYPFASLMSDASQHLADFVPLNQASRQQFYYGEDERLYYYENCCHESFRFTQLQHKIRSYSTFVFALQFSLIHRRG